MSASFQRQAVVPCAIRPVVRISGQATAPDITGLRCTPLDPPSVQEGEILRREGLNTPHELKVTYLLGPADQLADIPDGAALVIAGRLYPIKRKASYAPTAGA